MQQEEREGQEDGKKLLCCLLNVLDSFDFSSFLQSLLSKSGDRRIDSKDLPFLPFIRHTHTQYLQLLLWGPFIYWMMMMLPFLYEVPWETDEDDPIDQLGEETYDTERKKRKMCEVKEKFKRAWCSMRWETLSWPSDLRQRLSVEEEDWLIEMRIRAMREND